MVPLDHYRAMAAYNRWMNEKLYACSAKLSDDERKRDRGAFFGSIHGTLNHLLLADRAWLARFTGDRDQFTSRDRDGKPIVPTSLAHVLYEDFDDLRLQRVETDETIIGWLETLAPPALGAPLRYSSSDGKSHEHPMWWALTHFFNHQTHHRGQVTTLLTQAGRDVGVTDLIAMLRAGS